MQIISWPQQACAFDLLARLRQLFAESTQGSPSRIELDQAPYTDLWVAHLAQELSSLSPDLDTLSTLRDTWSRAPCKGLEGERLLRQSDDLLRRSLFDWMRRSRRLEEGAALEEAHRRLGPSESWTRPLRNYLDTRCARLVVIPTWQCELRCRYCTIPKQDGRVMDAQTLERSIQLLLSADSQDLELHFFGGEPFMEWELVQHALRFGEDLAPGRITYRFTTNGFALDPEKLAWLSNYSVYLQLSLDGDSETQNHARRSWDKVSDSYQSSPAAIGSEVARLGIDHELIQVIHPSNAARADTNLSHILDLGYRRIQLNTALGTRWKTADQEALARALHRAGQSLLQRWESGESLDLVNLRETRMKIRTNREITVDWDGTVLSSNAFLYVPRQREHYVLGHLNDARGFDRYRMGGASADELLQWWYSPEILANNQAVGAIMGSFTRWLVGERSSA